MKDSFINLAYIMCVYRMHVNGFNMEQVRIVSCFSSGLLIKGVLCSFIKSSYFSLKSLGVVFSNAEKIL